MASPAASLSAILPALRRSANSALGLLTLPAPAGALDAFLAAPIAGEAHVWDPAVDECGDTAWTVAGRGIAARVDASGSSCTASLQSKADALLDGVLERRDPLAWDAPAPRLFGGFAFSPGACDSIWQDFGEASFVLPRWTYGERAGRGFLRFAFDASGEPDPGNELAILVSALNGPSLPGEAAGRASIADSASAGWDALLRQALAEIAGGAFEKVVLARRLAVDSTRPFSLRAALSSLRRQAGPTTRFAIQRGEAVFLGATPERLVSLCGETVECDALGGSMPRRPGDDSARLLESSKDLREHGAVVRGIRNALAPFCRSVEYPRRPLVRSLSAVHHLHTPIRGRLARPAHVLELVAALHPTPAVCGFPRKPAASFLASHEPVSRGWYAAPVGWFDLGGDGCFAVALRSALVRGSQGWLYAGAGIVQGSDPAAEFRETEAKAATMLRALGVTG